MKLEPGHKVTVLRPVKATVIVDGVAYMDSYNLELGEGLTFIYKGPQSGSYEFSPSGSDHPDYVENYQNVRRWGVLIEGLELGKLALTDGV